MGRGKKRKHVKPTARVQDVGDQSRVQMPSYSSAHKPYCAQSDMLLDALHAYDTAVAEPSAISSTRTQQIQQGRQDTATAIDVPRSPVKTRARQAVSQNTHAQSSLYESPLMQEVRTEVQTVSTDTSARVQQTIQGRQDATVAIDPPRSPAKTRAKQAMAQNVHAEASRYESPLMQEATTEAQPLSTPSTRTQQTQQSRISFDDAPQKTQTEGKSQARQSVARMRSAPSSARETAKEQSHATAKPKENKRILTTQKATQNARTANNTAESSQSQCARYRTQDPFASHDSTRYDTHTTPKKSLKRAQKKYHTKSDAQSIAKKPTAKDSVKSARKLVNPRIVSREVDKQAQQATADNYATETLYQAAVAAGTVTRIACKINARNTTRYHENAPNKRMSTVQKTTPTAKQAKTEFQKKQVKRKLQSTLRQQRKSGWTELAGVKFQEIVASIAAKTKQTLMMLKLGAGGFVALILLLCILSIIALPFLGVMGAGIMTSALASTYTSEDPDTIATDVAYTALEQELQDYIDNIESTSSGYDEYRYDLDAILHDPHELAAYLHAINPYYTAEEMATELEKVLGTQYELTLTPSSETRYRTETRYHNGERYTVEVAYEWKILTVTLVNNGVDYVANTLLNADQLEMYELRRLTLGNKPLLFGGGSSDTTPSTDLSGVIMEPSTRPDNDALIDIALAQVGQVGGEPYWSWYGFDDRVAWCATFVSWCLDQAGYDEPRFSACQDQGIPWFKENGQWAEGNYKDLAAGDVIFFDWVDEETGLQDGHADHVGLVVGTDGEYVYTVEGNSGDKVATRKYSLDSVVIVGYGIMNVQEEET